MGLLKRVTGGGSQPEWCAHLTRDQYASLRGDVRSVLGRDLSTDAELADSDYAEAWYGLISLASVAGRMPDREWSQGVRARLSRSMELKTAGDAVEAQSATLDAARPNLRLALVRQEQLPSGDIGVPSVLPDCVDVLTLDTRTSDRNVSERLAAGWATETADLVDIAEGQVLSLPLDRDSRALVGKPLVKAVSIEEQGPYAGPLLRHVAEVVPDAIGMLGTLVGVPAGGGFFYVALDATPTLRADILELALLHSAVERKSARPLAKLPHWRKVDGTFVEVRLRIDEPEGVMGSYHAGFEGVLAALDPLTFLPVAAWAEGTFSVAQYTRFAGIVSATRDVRPEEVELLGSAWSLRELADRCRSIEVDEWPVAIAEHVASMSADLASSKSIIDNWRNDPAAVRDHLGVYLAPQSAVLPTMTTRPTAVAGLFEVLCVYADEATALVQPEVAADLGPADELFEVAERALRNAIQQGPFGEPFLTAQAVAVQSRPAASALLPHFLDWIPQAAGPGGALVSIGRSELLVALPVSDRSFVLDLPAFAGLAFGMYDAAEWPGTQAAYWVRPDGISVIEARTGPTGRVVGVRADPDLARRVAELPEAPVPPAAAEVLGVAAGLRFLGMLRSSILEGLAAGRLPVVLEAFNVRDFARLCSEAPSERWGEVIRQRMDDVARDGIVLDAMEDGMDLAAVRAALSVRVERGMAAAVPEVSHIVPGGLIAKMVLVSGGRRRQVRHRMLEHWGLDEQAAWAAAGSNLASDPGLVDEQIEGAPPFARQIYHREFEAEAVGLYLHLRPPTARRGFVVSITHGSRAHYLRLDDPGSFETIPVFAEVVRGIYTEAAKHQDAMSSWLLWLRPDGQVVELFDVLKPTPPISEMPPGMRPLS